MTRQSSINAQIKRATEILPKIEAEYNESLNKKSISEDLKLDIHTFLGHLRSSLDYLAHDMVEKYCPKKKAGDRLYFPIRHDKASFVDVMSKSYPELITNCPNLYNFLESIQPYMSNNNLWLAQFNELNNENKHNNLVEQRRVETRRVQVTGAGGGSVSWGSGVTFGSGVSIMGVPINPHTQLPIQNNIVNTEIITWVDFRFQEIDVSALHLLKESLKQIQLISSQVELYL